MRARTAGVAAVLFLTFGAAAGFAAPAERLDGVRPIPKRQDGVRPIPKLLDGVRPIPKLADGVRPIPKRADGAHWSTQQEMRA